MAPKRQEKGNVVAGGLEIKETATHGAAMHLRCRLTVLPTGPFIGFMVCLSQKTLGEASLLSLSPSTTSDGS